MKLSDAGMRARFVRTMVSRYFFGPAMPDPESAWVFISHSHQDRKVAETLCKAIESRGSRCWIATRDVPPGGNYQDYIASAIEKSSAMILVFSLSSNNSQEIKKELALAGQYSTSVIPVRVEDVMPVGAFKYELSTRQWIDLFRDWEGAMNQIVQRISVRSADAAAASPVISREPSFSRSWIVRHRWRLVTVGIAFLLLSAVGGAYLLLRQQDLDAPAVFPETDATRLTAFTICTPPTEYKAGFRHWTRVAPDRWLEEYPDHTQGFLDVIRRIHVSGCDGSVVSPSYDKNFQVFLPDKSCDEKQFLFRRLPNPAWISYVPLEKPGADCPAPAGTTK